MYTLNRIYRDYPYFFLTQSNSNLVINNMDAEKQIRALGSDIRERSCYTMA
eukprot:SAG31_NODE_15148_length_768_cov_0.787743_1_plen_50_part_10